MRLQTVTLTLVCAASALLGTTAQAADRYFYHAQGSAQPWSNDNASTGFWYSDSAHTTRAAKPTSDETAQIDANCYLDENGFCESVAVLASIQLELANGSAGYRLELGDANGRISSVSSGGIILLSDDTAELRAMYSHTLDGPGEIRGTQGSARISIADDRILSNNMDSVGIAGTLQIVDANNNGTFANHGRVNANASGVLLLAPHTLSSSSGSDRWMCSDASAALDFSPASYGTMAGEFKLSAGEMEINTELTATGRLDISGGLFEVRADTALGSVGNPLNQSGGEIQIVANDPELTFTHQ